MKKLAILPIALVDLVVYGLVWYSALSLVIPGDLRGIYGITLAGLACSMIAMYGATSVAADDESAPMRKIVLVGLLSPMVGVLLLGLFGVIISILSSTIGMTVLFGAVVISVIGGAGTAGLILSFIF